MKKLLVLLVFIILICSVNASIEQISYDDGSADSGEEFGASYGEITVPGDQYQIKKVKFTPNELVTIHSIETNWWDNTGENWTEKYFVNIYDTSFQPLMNWTVVYNPDFGWNSLDISSYNIQTDQPFYVILNAPVDYMTDCSQVQTLGVDVVRTICTGTISDKDEMDLSVDEDNSGESFYHYGFNLNWEGYPHPSNYMVRVTVQDNIAPTVDSIADSPDPVLSGNEITITSSNVNDRDQDTLQMVCAYREDAKKPTQANNVCKNFPQNSAYPYTDLNCVMDSDLDELRERIHCRIYDGEFYSSKKTVRNLDDSTAPEVNIYLGDDAGDSSEYDDDGTVYATLSNSDFGGIDNCEIDWGTGYMPISKNKKSDNENLADGIWDIYYRCTDKVGLSEFSRNNITVDTVAPIAPTLFLNSVENDPWDTDGNLLLSWSGASDATSGLDYYEVYRKKNTESWELIATLSLSPRYYNQTGLHNNTDYSYKVRVYDKAGHYSESNEESITVDTENPTTQIISPIEGEYFTSDSVELSVFYANHYEVDCRAMLDQQSSWEEDMDGEGLVTGTATKEFDDISEGWHKFTAQCFDRANLSSMDQVNFFVDTINPIVSLTLGDEQYGDDLYDNDGMVWGQTSNEDPGYFDNPQTGSGIDYCEIDYDGTWRPYNKFREHGSRNFDDGELNIYYRCFDLAGNVGNDEDTIYVDTMQPETSYSVNGNNPCGGEWYNSDVTVTLNPVDPLNNGYASGISKTYYSIDDEDYEEYDSSFTITKEGTTTIHYYSTDIAGNVEDEKELIIKLDKSNPDGIFTFPLETEHLANPNIQFYGLASDNPIADHSGVMDVEIMIQQVSDDSVVLDWTLANGISDWSYLAWNAPENIEYYATLRVTDNACNQEIVDVVTFTKQDDYDYRYYTKEEIDQVVAEIDSKITNLSSQVNLNTENITVINKQIDAIFEALYFMQGDISSLFQKAADLDARLTDVEKTVEEMNHGTINLYHHYNNGVNELRVWGEAPVAATEAKICVIPSTETVTLNPSNFNHCILLETTNVETHAGNSNWYNKWIDVSDIDPVKYNVVVFFYEESSYMSYFNVGLLFDDLFINRMQEQIFVLFGWTFRNTIMIHSNHNEIIALWDETENLWDDSADQLAEINNLWANNSYLFSEVAELWKDSENQWNQIIYLNDSVNLNAAMIDSLTSKVEAMNHGTLNIMYKPLDEKLLAWGEAPDGAVQATITVQKTSDKTQVYSATVGIEELRENGNYYRFKGANSIDTSDWEKVSYDVSVTFGLRSSYKVTEIFTNLELEGIQESISVLNDEVSDLWIAVNDNTEEIEFLWDDSENQWIEINALKEENESLWAEVNELWLNASEQWNQIDTLWLDSSAQWSAIKDLEERVGLLEDNIESMNHGTINLFYSNKDAEVNPHTVRVYGESPLGAEYFSVMAVSPDNSIVYNSGMMNTDVLNTYDHYMSLAGFEISEYNIRVQFYYADEELMNGYEVSALFDELLHYGILDIVMSSRVETLYNPSVNVPVTYTVRVDETLMDATIIIRSTNDSEVDFTQVLRTQTLFAGDYYTFSDMVYFNELGNYDFVIEIVEPTWTSTSFNVELINLASETPESSAFITAPLINWNNEMIGLYPNMENPFMDYSEISWISWAASEEDYFDMDVTLLEGTSINWCEWLLEHEELNDVNGQMDITEIETLRLAYADQDLIVRVCQEKIFEDDLFPFEGIYTLTGRAQFSGIVSEYTYLEDMIYFGVDNTNPVINQIIPDQGVYNGVLTVTVDVTDTLSGIDTVWVSLVDKTNASIVYTLEAEFNNDTQLYEALFDTIAMEIPDNDYNTSVTVYDIAGNSVTGVVDPTIDNTAPIYEKSAISNTICSKYMDLDIYGFFSDETSYINSNSVYALITGPNSTNITDVRVNLTDIVVSRYHGKIYLPEMISGNYTIEYHASDAAGNEKIVTVEETVEIITCSSSSSGGSSSGGGSSISSFPKKLVSNWECGEWTECDDSGKQTRECTDLNSITNPSKVPDTEKECIFIPVEGNKKETTNSTEETVPQKQVTSEPEPEPQASTEEPEDSDGMEGITGAAINEGSNPLITWIFVLFGFIVVAGAIIYRVHK